MEESLNTPYVKQYDENGKVKNDFKEYKSEHPNRSERREKPKRFMGCGKNYPLTVLQTGKYLRRIQEIICKDGSVKRIEHYTLL